MKNDGKGTRGGKREKERCWGLTSSELYFPLYIVDNEYKSAEASGERKRSKKYRLIELRREEK